MRIINGLNIIREICNLTLEDAANLLGVTKQSVSKWCNGVKPIPLNRVKQLSQKLHIDEKYFTLDDVDDMTRLEIENQYLFNRIQGTIVIEDMTISEGDKGVQIHITPKNQDTDPRFSKINQNMRLLSIKQNLKELDSFANDCVDKQNGVAALEMLDEVIDLFTNLFFAPNTDILSLIEILNGMLADAEQGKN